MSLSAVPDPELSPLEALNASLRQAAARMYPRWRVWITDDGAWHAIRRGTFRPTDSNRALHHISSLNMGLFFGMLEEQDKIVLPQVEWDLS